MRHRDLAFRGDLRRAAVLAAKETAQIERLLVAYRRFSMGPGLGVS